MTAAGSYDPRRRKAHPRERRAGDEGLSEAEAIVVSVSRRTAWVDTGSGPPSKAAVPRSSEDPAVGDGCRVAGPGSPEAKIVGVSPRRNVLRRSYFGKTRLVAANVDLLVIVTAAGPLFNPSFVDRALVAAEIESIPSVVVVNKTDVEPLSAGHDGPGLYRDVGVPVVPASAATGEGLAGLLETLSDPAVSVAVFTGVSGVGKSSLMNRLFPGCARRTGEVSGRTGQGKQTTSRSEAHRAERPSRPLYVVDSPGIQQFGLTHLDVETAARGFVDVARFARSCRFRDCAHGGDEGCAVEDAVRDGLLAPSRLRSLREIRDEIVSANPFGRDEPEGRTRAPRDPASFDD